MIPKSTCLGLVLMAALSAGLFAAETSTTATSPQLSAAAGLTVTAALREFSPTPEMKGTVHCLGTGISVVTLVSLSRALREVQPNVQLDLGLPTGQDMLASLVGGSADIIALTYVPSAEVLKKYSVPGRELVAVPFAIDPVVFFVNAHNPIAGLSLAQVKAMLERHLEDGPRAETWADVGVKWSLAASSIHGVVLNQNIEQNTYFRKHVLKIEAVRLDVRFAPTPGAGLCEVGADVAAFGIASLLYATPATRVVPLVTPEGVTVVPDVTAVQSGKYPLTRTLTLVAVKRDGQLPPLTREILSYVISRRAQRQIVSLGIFPVTTDMQQQSLVMLR